MDCRNNVFGSGDGIALPLLAVLLTLLMVMGCSAEPDPDEDHPGADPIDVPQMLPDDGDGDVSSDVTNEDKFPPDTDADDLPGLIVTGLDGVDSSQIVSPWLVSIRRFRHTAADSSAGALSVELTRYADDFPVLAHLDFFSENRDGCLIRNDPHEPGSVTDNPPPDTIDGGVTVVLNTASGPHLSIPRTALSDGQLVYEARDELRGSLPAGITLSVPGAAFPTVAAYRVFEPEPVERLLPEASQPVTAETYFSWIPLNQAGYVKLDFMAYDANGKFQYYPASCWVEDDGSFGLPDSLIDALPGAEPDGEALPVIRVRYSRVYSRVDVIDGIVFHQSMEVAENGE